MPSTASTTLATLVLLNLLFPVYRFIFWAQHLPATIDNTSLLDEDVQSYSYIGNDYPFYHPTLVIKDALLMLQETVHYGFNASTDPDSSKEWDQMLDSPEGSGRIHLVELKEALVNRDTTWATPHHVNHCLQYLRQTFLCQANDALEEGDFMERNFATNRHGPEVQCNDWESVYQQVGAHWLLFLDWKKHVDSM